MCVSPRVSAAGREGGRERGAGVGWSKSPRRYPSKGRGGGEGCLPAHPAAGGGGGSVSGAADAGSGCA